MIRLQGMASDCEWQVGSVSVIDDAETGEGAAAAQERAEHISEWMGLKDKLSQLVPVSKGGRGKESGVRAAARELGIPRMEAHRAVKIAAIVPAAKEAARKAARVVKRSGRRKPSRNWRPCQIMSSCTSNTSAEPA